MVPDRQKVWTDVPTDGWNGRMDTAKTISLRLRRGIIKKLDGDYNYFNLILRTWVVFQKIGKMLITNPCQIMKNRAW